MKIKNHLTLSKALFAVLSLFALFALANPKEARAEEKELRLSQITTYNPEYQSGSLVLSNNKEYKLIIDADNVEINDIKGTFQSQFSGIKLTIEGNSDNSDYTLTCNGIAYIENLVINSGKIKVNGAINCYNIMITGGSVTVNNFGTAIRADNEIIIKGGNVIARSETGGGIYAISKILISGGSVDVYGLNGISMNNRGIIEISGKETKVKAKGIVNNGDGGIAIIGGYGGELKLVKPVKISEPEGGIVTLCNVPGFRGHMTISTDQDGTEPADYVLIESGSIDPTDNPSAQTSKRSYVKRDDDEDAVTEEYTKSAPVNKDALVITKMSGFPAGTFFAKQEQGIAAKNAFLGALPAGYKSAFTFNVITNGKTPDLSLKKGSFTLLIPEEFRKPGRTFAILALDKSGKAILLTDTDTDPTTITVSLNLEGYAFDLIYKD